MGSHFNEMVSRHVGRVINRLQAGYLPAAGREVPTAHASASIATLRHAKVGDPVGDVRVWQVTLADIPKELLGDSSCQPTAAEYAIHAALVLWARHQQSREMPMHVTGPSLGAAVRKLSLARSPDGDLDGPSLRRFHSVATAQGQQQLFYHLRSLISLLRAHEIPLDYARLASDLYLLNRGYTDGVLLRWGRDLHRAPKSTDTSPSTDLTA